MKDFSEQRGEIKTDRKAWIKERPEVGAGIVDTGRGEESGLRDNCSRRAGD